MREHAGPKIIHYRGQWCVRFYDAQGKRQRQALHTQDRAEAEARYSLWLKQWKGKATTVTEVLQRYWDEHGKDTSSAKRTAISKAHIERALGRRRAESLDRAVCHDYRDARLGAGVSPATVRTELTVLRAALHYCARVEYIDKAPFVWLPQAGNPRERYLTRDEARRLLDACTAPHIKLAILLGLYTGARCGAILGLRWQQVGFDTGFIDYRDPFLKGRRKGRAIVPIAESLKGPLEEARKAARTLYVIEYADQRVFNLQRGFGSAVERAGLEGVTFHTLRRTAAVWMAEGGVTMDEIAQILGHEDSRTTYRTYARFSPGHMRKAIAILDGGGTPRLVQVGERKERI